VKQVMWHLNLQSRHYDIRITRAGDFCAVAVLGPGWGFGEGQPAGLVAGPQCGRRGFCLVVLELNRCPTHLGGGLWR
jgi:hypothetical protein